VLNVNEIFFSIQGEGTRVGRPSVFVRLTGCPLRCVWCDTTYAFHEGTRQALEAVVAAAERHPTRLLCLTGGEPLAQPEAFHLVSRLLDRGWEVVVETSGHVSIARLDPRAVAVMDVKAPGSGENGKMDWANLGRLRAKDEAKFVLDGRDDYEWARRLVREKDVAGRCTVLFSAVHGVLDPGTLGRWILEDGLPVRLQVQLHKVLWPSATRGA
jgi:7-carboxy-7-deazaguanine synthase